MTDLNEISPITERFRLNQAKAGQFLIDTLLERVATRVPKGWDATIECAVCGLVPIFPGGSKAVFGCPWCIAGVSAP